MAHPATGEAKGARTKGSATTSRGRPRDAALDSKVLAATKRIVAAHGYTAATVDQIAAEAAVAKGSIYRRWASKGVLVYDAMVRNDELPQVIDSGDIAADLVAIGMITNRGFRARSQRTVLDHVLADAARDPQLAELLRTRFFAPRSAVIAERVRLAIERGELRPDIDPALVPAVLNGSQQYWWGVWRRPMTEAEIRGLVALIVGGPLGSRPDARASGRRAR
jgi:AcrR family transcriptional regulator